MRSINGPSLTEVPLKKEIVSQKEIARNLVKNMRPTENEIDLILSENLSFSQYDRLRLQRDFEKNTECELSRKKPITNFDNYSFDKEQFLLTLSAEPAGASINWTQWAREKFPVTVSGTMPTNAGYVLQSFAQCNGIDVFKFNTNKTVSGRDILARARKKKRKLCPGVSLPGSKPGKVVKMELKSQIEEKHIRIGEPIVPKTVTFRSGSTGVVYARQRFLSEILTTELQRLEHECVIRDNLGENVALHIKVWHDHATVAGRSHFAVMAQVWILTHIQHTKWQTHWRPVPSTTHNGKWCTDQYHTAQGGWG